MLDADGTWPSYPLDSGNTGADPDGDGVRDGEEYWRLDGGGHHPPVARRVRREPAAGRRGGRVFVTTFVGALCFDTADGERLWRGPETNGITGQSAVVDGRVYVATDGFEGARPHLRALDAGSGETAWRYGTAEGGETTPAVGDGALAWTGRRS